MAEKIDFPNHTQHTFIAGKTGEGKTHAGIWHLSARNFERQPWVIIDTKGDDLINEIGEFPRVKHIGFSDRIGKSGLHIIHPHPDQADHLDTFLKHIWDKQNCGVFVDEGHVIGKIDGVERLLVSGRSRRCPLIFCTQRPVWITRFALSEASFLQVFHLTDEDDRRTVKRFLPPSYDMNRRLPKRHSLWYEVEADRVSTFAPVPDRDTIMQSFRDKLRPKRLLV